MKIRYFGTLKKLICVFMWSKRGTVKRGVVFINETIPHPIGFDG
jgi:hypothetical protein